MPTLVYWDSDGIERLFDIGAEPLMIGRASECQIRSDDTRVSRRHARIITNGRDCWIEDLGSANGVYVGPNRVTQSHIPPGEIVVVGSILLQLQSANGQLVAPSAGTHAQLSVWLKMEREKRATLAQERNALGERVSQLHLELAKRAPSPSMDPDELEQKLEDARKKARKELEAELGDRYARDIDRIRAEHSAAKDREVARVRAELEAAKEREIARVRAELEAELDVTQAQRHRTEVDVSGQLQAQVQQLWGNLRDAKQTIAQLEAEVRSGRERAEAAEAARRELEEEAARLGAEIEHLSSSQQHGGDRLAALEAEKTELEVQLAGVQDAAEQAQAAYASQLQALKDERDKLARALQEAEDELAGLREEANRALDEAEKEVQTLAAQCDQFAERLDVIAKERDELVRELEALRSGNDQAAQDAEIELAAANDRLREVEAVIQALQDERNELARQLDERGATPAHKDRLALLKQRDELEHALDEIRRERDKLASELSALRTARENDERAYAARLAETERTRAALAEELERSAAEVEAARAMADDLSEAEQHNATLAADLETLRRTIEDTRVQGQRALAEAHEEIRRLGAEIEERERELEGLHQTQDELAEELERARQEGGGSSQLRGELEAARTQAARLGSELEASRAQADSDRTLRRQAEDRLAEAENRLAELKARVQSLQAELAARPAGNGKSAGGVPAGTGEHLLALQDCIAALRASMRAASDEAAVMPGDSASVQVVNDALSDATQHIETARDSLRSLSSLLGVE